ncbi:MAG: NAD(P)H-binding protein [Flavobacteriales bacterium]
MPNKTAIVLGASGSVGQALLPALVGSGAFTRIIVLARKPLAVQAGVDVRVVPRMEPAELEQAVIGALSESQDAIGFSVLGVGAGTAKLSLEEHRAVDVELNAAFARGLKASGKVRHLLFMSAMGANINARTTGSGAAGMPRYARVKGEAEAAVRAQGPAVVSIFRPAMILGSKHTPKLLAAIIPLFTFLTPARFRSIRTTEIAQAMLAAALRPPAESAIYTYAEMMALIGKG